MKIPPVYFVYFAAAVLIGLIFSFGIIGVTHQPLPVQVQIDPYQPYQAPSPAIPTISPSVKTTDQFAPASAPVVVTTAPLPTITPDQTKTYPVDCSNIGAKDVATSSVCITQTYVGAASMMGLLFCIIFISLILAFLIRL